MSGFVREHGFGLILTVGTLLGAIGGGFVAFTETGVGGRTATLDESVPTDSDRFGSLVDGDLVDGGSSAIKFPSDLSKLPVDQPNIAIADDGTVWIVGSNAQGQIVLTRSDEGASTEHYRLPNILGNRPLVDLDAAGNPVVAVGEQLIMVQRDTVDIKTIGLAKVEATGALSPAGQIVGLQVVGETAFVQRFEINTLFEVSLDSGAVVEIDLPESFGEFHDFVAGETAVWFLKTLDDLGGPQSHVGRLERSSGKFEVIEVKVHSADIVGDGIVATSWDPDRLVYVDSNGVRVIDSRSFKKDFVGKQGPYSITLADGKGGAWIADVTANTILSVDPSSADSYAFSLPLSQTRDPSVCMSDDGPRPGCVDMIPIYTRVTDMAVTSGGDLYFVDETTNSVGVIQRPQ